MKRDVTHKIWRRDSAGYLLHDGDCSAWDIGLCTCGLIHHLMPVSNPEKYMPDYWAQRGRHDTIVNDLVLNS